MSIVEITPPEVRSRLWSDEDAKQAYELLTQEKAAKYGEYVSAEDEHAESKARTQGMALDRLIQANHGRRFGVSVWKDQNGNYIGALIPRAPRARKTKAAAKGK